MRGCLSCQKVTDLLSCLFLEMMLAALWSPTTVSLVFMFRSNCFTIFSNRTECFKSSHDVTASVGVQTGKHLAGYGQLDSQVLDSAAAIACLRMICFTRVKGVLHIQNL